MRERTQTGVVALTHLGLKDAPFGTRNRLTQIGKFFKDAGDRAHLWERDARVVYQLFDAYLDFEAAKPVSSSQNGRRHTI